MRSKRGAGSEVANGAAMLLESKALPDLSYQFVKLPGTGLARVPPFLCALLFDRNEISESKAVAQHGFPNCDR
jgi:hypothetical protein